MAWGEQLFLVLDLSIASGTHRSYSLVTPFLPFDDFTLRGAPASGFSLQTVVRADSMSYQILHEVPYGNNVAVQ